MCEMLKIRGKKYKMARNKTRKAVSKVRVRTFDRLYQSLGTKEEERSIYRLDTYKGKKDKIFRLGTMHYG